MAKAVRPIAKALREGSDKLLDWFNWKESPSNQGLWEVPQAVTGSDEICALRLLRVHQVGETIGRHGEERLEAGLRRRDPMVLP